MYKGVGEFYVNLSGLRADQREAALGVLNRVNGEETSDYPRDKLKSEGPDGFKAIPLKDFLPIWIRLEKERIEKAEVLADILGLKIPE